jgi:3-hydroxyacyl-CoA dehydrogenase/enoyl-CoA hydratase/3-hydroxybutyryl-CoA epimerase
VHRHTHFTHDELAQRMSLLMVNEAARCVEEQVAASPADIDLAMVLGTGFAPFHGGPLRYADSMGIPNLVAALEKLAAVEPRFTPCALLKRMAATNQLFYPNIGDQK